MEETSLEDFVEGDDSAASEAATDAPETVGGDGDPSAEPVTDGEQAESTEASDIEPATVTARFRPDGGQCAGCGSTVQRRWEQAGAFYCRECKRWE